VAGARRATRLRSKSAVEATEGLAVARSEVERLSAKAAEAAVQFLEVRNAQPHTGPTRLRFSYNTYVYQI